MTSSPIRLAARTIALITALTIVGAARAEAQDSAYWEAYKKQVEAVKRDTIPQNAYQGWKQYELNCSRCHGEYGVGTSFAPSLIVSLKDGGTVPDQTAFITVVCQGRTDKGMPGVVRTGPRNGQDPEHLRVPEASRRRQGRGGPASREGRRLSPTVRRSVVACAALLVLTRAAEPATAQAQHLTAAQVTEQLAQATGAAPADFSGADLSGLVLEGVDFKRANLTGARLAGAKLAGADLFSCDLTDAVLEGADLRKANLDGSTLRRANLSRADLRGASLFATIIESANLNGADLRDTRIIGYLRGATLVDANLSNANIGADPGNQSMGVMRAQFVSADLTGADFTGANLFKADFSFASLRKAKLVDANLQNADLAGTDFTGADVTGAQFNKANVDGAIFIGIVGRDQMKGLDEARNVDKATFSAP